MAAQESFRPTSRTAKPTSLLIIIPMFLIGVGLTWVLYNMVGNQIAFERGAQPAEGQVVAMKESLSTGKLQTPVWAPVFRFTTADGRTVDAIGDDPSSPAFWKVGETGHLLYDPANPTHAMVNTVRGRWTASLVLALVTLSFYAASILGLRSRGWRLF